MSRKSSDCNPKSPRNSVIKNEKDLMNAITKYFSERYNMTDEFLRLMKKGKIAKKIASNKASMVTKTNVSMARRFTNNKFSTRLRVSTGETDLSQVEKSPEKLRNEISMMKEYILILEKVNGYLNFVIQQVQPDSVDDEEYITEESD